ncbi:MAG TPA: helix-turn-helix domain-containing protein [Bryobacteraceae bacterium]|jgi:excisionase family DNA binding protein|nr:helix-turn-helix domain-containing protein [Bryobacteraceae bacterium]
MSSNFPEVLTVTEVALRLRCSKAHVCNAINGKVRGVTPLPAVNMGRRKLIRASALSTWLVENEPGKPDAIILASSGIDAVGASKGLHDA